MNEQKELLANLLLELRRGTIVLSVLSIARRPTYGYALVQVLEEKGLRSAVMEAVIAAGEMSAAMSKEGAK